LKEKRSRTISRLRCYLSVSVDLSEINHKPMPARSPAGDPRSLKAQLAGVVEHERAVLLSSMCSFNRSPGAARGASGPY